jgi:uncharacterized protein (UPF0276 family)
MTGRNDHAAEWWQSGDDVRIGLAYNAYVPGFLTSNGAAIDYVEVPFELLRHDPGVIAIQRQKPIVLHCASMSIAGAVPPSRQTVDDIDGWTQRTATPWIGEHLSFVTADRALAGDGAEPYAPGEPYNIGYTVSPPMNRASVDTVVRAMEFCHACFATPVLLENAPIYFVPPGTTMSQIEFVSAICDRSDAGLLLDLAHFYITSQTLGFDPFKSILQYPLNRVVEAHISGVASESGELWDNHANRAPPEVHRLLEIAVANAPRLRAITLEYNWSSRFPQDVLLEEIERVRATAQRSAAGSRSGA